MPPQVMLSCMRMGPLSIGQFLEIAAAVRDEEAKAIKDETDLGLAESALHAPFAGFGDYELFPTFAEKVAILGSRIAKNHALTDGNKRTALVAMGMFATGNGGELNTTDQDAVAQAIEDVSSGEMHEDDFVAFVQPLVTEP